MALDDATKVRQKARRLSNARLDKEITFSTAFGPHEDGTPERTWHNALIDERTRRSL